MPAMSADDVDRPLVTSQRPDGVARRKIKIGEGAYETTSLEDTAWRVSGGRGRG